MSGKGDKPRTSRRGLTEEDRALWRGVTRSIAPLKRARAERVDETGSPGGAPEAPRAGKRIARPPAAPAAPRPAAKPAPPLAPIERKLKQRLARGIDDIDARIDLHGKTQSQAHSALLRFLRKAQADGARIVLVITGKGAMGASDSGERGVLKRHVPQWLSLPEFRPYVAGVGDAHIGHGGQGALYVRVRRAPRT